MTRCNHCGSSLRGVPCGTDKQRANCFTRTDSALYAADPDTIGDQDLARLVADLLMVEHGPTYRLSIFHDVRPSAPQRIVKKRKYFQSTRVTRLVRAHFTTTGSAGT